MVRTRQRLIFWLAAVLVLGLLVTPLAALLARS
jgi:hypothetical protein